jgi:3-oxoacyl-[acyl-carrier protein] reductase
MKLKGKIALVTGGSSGIGEAIALRFGEEGAMVAVVASHDKTKAESVAARIRKAGGQAQAFSADICKIPDINKMVAEVTKAFGEIDILVNSAGVFFPTPMGDTKEEDFDRIWDVNMKGSYFCTNAVVPSMKQRHRGIIINVASAAGVIAMGGYSAYCANKAAIIMFTRALTSELGPLGIRVNCISPGNTATPMNLDIRTDPKFKSLLETMNQRTPSRRTYSEALDMANVAVFLASDDSRAMHGANVLADEGLSAGL